MSQAHDVYASSTFMQAVLQRERNAGLLPGLPSAGSFAISEEVP